MRWITITLGALVGALAAVVVRVRRAMRWGATPEEVASASTADTWFDGVPGHASG